MKVPAFKEFRDAKPFPHVVIEDFIPQNVIRAINAEWPKGTEAWREHHHKHSAKRGCPLPVYFGRETASVIAGLNSLTMLRSLEEMTGIANLKADPELIGGGLHETLPEGFLDVHVDFNRHPETGFHRRLNLLLFLNQGWNPDWQGDLWLCDPETKDPAVCVTPEAGRCVIFATTDKSFHGHPLPLRCPEDRSRRSIALYYYSETRPASEITREHSTLYAGDEAWVL